MGGQLRLAGVDERVETLMACTPVLATARPEARRRLVECGSVHRYARDACVFQQGDRADEVFLLVEGRVEITSVSPDGHRQWHATLEPPQLFGELGVLDGAERPAAARTVTPALVWSAPGGALVEFLHDDPDAALALLRALASQVHAFGGLVDDLLCLDLRGRVAKRLLGLVTTSFDDLPPDGVSVPPGVTQADLASLAGGSRENVCRILSEMQRDGLVSRHGRRYVLRDIERLRRLART